MSVTISIASVRWKWLFTTVVIEDDSLIFLQKKLTYGNFSLCNRISLVLFPIHTFSNWLIVISFGQIHIIALLFRIWLISFIEILPKYNKNVNQQNWQTFHSNKPSILVKKIDTPCAIWRTTFVTMAHWSRLFKWKFTL